MDNINMDKEHLEGEFIKDLMEGIRIIIKT